MRIVLTLLGAVAAAAGVLLPAAACGGGSEASAGPDRTQVVASFYPLAFAAEEVGGAAADVTNLTPPGGEPHDLEVSPGDVRSLRDADLVLLLGGGFQPQLERAAGEGERVVRLLETPGLEPLPDGDPHVWLDPVRFARLAERVGAELGREDAAGRLATRLEELDGDFRSGLARCERRELVTSHAAFAYLAERYGLRQVAITGSSPEAEPSPGDLERVLDVVRATGATTVFAEPLVSPRVAETVARAAGAEVAVLNPLEGLTPEQAESGEDYFSLMRANLAALREALGCS